MTNSVAVGEPAPARTLSASPVMLFVVIYTLAFIVTTVLHELAHALTSALFGGQPVLHHVYVRHRLTSGLPAAAAAAAGPLFSAVQGLLILALARAVSRWRPAARLFGLWLCAHGLINFSGYLLTTPFTHSGDLGKVAALLELPAAARWAIFGVGALGVLAVGAAVTRPLLQLAHGPEQVADPRGRARAIFQIAIVPWWSGAALLALVSYPASTWLPYVHDVLAGFFLFGTWRRAARLSPPAVASEQWADESRWPWSLGLAAAVAVMLALHDGVRIGW